MKQNKPGLFQQVGAHTGSHYVVVLAETDLNVFPKSTAVVITRCLGITNSLKWLTKNEQMDETLGWTYETKHFT